jgi:hypothetical protein
MSLSTHVFHFLRFFCMSIVGVCLCMHRANKSEGNNSRMTIRRKEKNCTLVTFTFSFAHRHYNYSTKKNDSESVAAGYWKNKT